MNVRIYKIVIVTGYSLILGVIAISTLFSFNLRELFKFVLFLIFFTTWVYFAFSNAENIKIKEDENEEKKEERSNAQ